MLRCLRLQHGMVDKGKLLREIYKSLCKLIQSGEGCSQGYWVTLQRAKAVRGHH